MGSCSINIQGILARSRRLPVFSIPRLKEMSTRQGACWISSRWWRKAYLARPHPKKRGCKRFGIGLACSSAVILLLEQYCAQRFSGRLESAWRTVGARNSAYSASSDALVKFVARGKKRTSHLGKHERREMSCEVVVFFGWREPWWYYKTGMRPCRGVGCKGDPHDGMK